MTKIAVYKVKIHSTKDKKELKSGMKEYEYGTINIRDSKLKDYIGKIVKLSVEDTKPNNELSNVVNQQKERKRK